MRIAKSFSLVFVAGLIAMLGMLAFMPVQASAAEPNSKLTFKVTVTEPVTTVGQMPKLIIETGNQGPHTIKNFGMKCFYNSAVLKTDAGFYTAQKMIVGQNVNWEIRFKAIAPGTSYAKCYSWGTDEVTGVTVYSPAVWYKIVVKA